MDDSCFFTYIRRKPLTDDGGYPGYTKHHRFHPSPDGTTIDGHSPVIAKSIPISIPPAAAVVAYTEPGTPALHKAEGFFQRILLNSRFTSTPQATITTTTTTRSAAVAIPIVVKQLNTGLPLYTRRFGTTAMLLDRRVTSIRARYETLESEKLKRSNSIPSLVKQVAWLSRNFDLKVQEVERLNRLIAEQGIGSSKSFGSSSSSTSAGEE
ncbi:hypothetical protein KEM54_003054 [Ascosphaera aggregata]|nr:hypothetical protein KEM54_003054 [Ascosphaera aggregata]